tara:strand:+ start:82 stop:1077 length:996 start_codon:yes stop_codon:yes gene_type:complete
MKNKILFFTSSLDGGGAEKQILRIYNSIKSDYESIFYTAKKNNYLEETLSLNRKKTSFALLSLVKEIKRFKPTDIFTTLPTPNIMNVLIKKYIYKEVKSIVRIANFNLYKRHTKFIIRNADIVCFNSVENMEKYGERYPKQASKFTYLNNIVIPTNDVNKKSIRSSPLKIVAASRLVEQKGLDLLVRTVNGIGGGVQVDIFGDGPERARLNKLDRGNFINFKGFQENINWEKYDLFVLPSRKEGMSNSLLEAQQHNVFSIVSDCESGNKELIELTKNGIIFKSDNLDDLKIKIINFINGDYKGVNSKIIVEQQFSEDSVNKKMIEIISTRL